MTLCFTYIVASSSRRGFSDFWLAFWVVVVLPLRSINEAKEFNLEENDLGIDDVSDREQRIMWVDAMFDPDPT